MLLILLIKKAYERIIQFIGKVMCLLEYLKVKFRQLTKCRAIM